MKITLLSAIVLISVAGCSSDAEPDKPSTVNYFGTAESVLLTGQTTQRFAAEFYKLSTEVEIDELKEIFDRGRARQPDIPSCIVVEAVPITSPPVDFSRESISAGENLVLTSSMGTVAEIERLRFSDTTVTMYDKFGLPLIPDNTTLSIPGDKFPAFDVPFPYTPPLLSDIQSDTMPVALDAEITWVAHRDAETDIYLHFVDEIGSAGVLCLSRDTGSFVFPQNVVDYFGVETPLIMYTFQRSKITYHYTDDAMLITYSLTSPFY